MNCWLLAQVTVKSSNNFCFNDFYLHVLFWGITKCIVTASSSLKIFCSRFVKCFPWSLALRKHFTNFWQKILNNDLDTSHYLYTELILVQSSWVLCILFVASRPGRMLTRSETKAHTSTLSLAISRRTCRSYVTICTRRANTSHSSASNLLRTGLCLSCFVLLVELVVLSGRWYHCLCDSNKLLYKRCAKSIGRPKFRPPTAPTFFNRSQWNLKPREISGIQPYTQNLVDVGRREGGLRREGIFRYFLCSILFLYSCSRLQVTPEDWSRPFMAQNACFHVR